MHTDKIERELLNKGKKNIHNWHLLVQFFFCMNDSIDPQESGKVKDQERKKRMFWVRDILKNKTSSEYHGFFQEIRLNDHEFLYRYLRMSKERFDHLYSLLKNDREKRYKFSYINSSPSTVGYYTEITDNW